MTTPIQAKKKKNYLSWILGCLGIFILVASIAINITLGVLLANKGLESVATSEPALSETCVDGNCEAYNKIAIIDVEGTILFQESTGSLFSPMTPAAESIAQQIRQATDDPYVSAIILNVNSPGGSVTASDFLYNEVLKAQEAGVKIVTYIKDTGASGAYYMTAPSDAILANPTALTGSIGVIISTLNYQGLFEKYGLKSVVYKSGKHKDLLSSTREQTEEEKQILQSIIDESQQRFLKIVTDNRELTAENKATIADGRIFTAQQAKAVNLIDDTGYFSDALQKTKEIAEVSDVAIIKYEQPFTFDQLFSGLGVLVNKEGNLVNNLKNTFYSSQTPQVMYLWQ